jgi:hypothetical protein
MNDYLDIQFNVAVLMSEQCKYLLLKEKLRINLMCVDVTSDTACSPHSATIPRTQYQSSNVLSRDRVNIDGGLDG